MGTAESELSIREQVKPAKREPGGSIWRVLNLGCGTRTFDSPGVVNCDLWKHSPAIDVAHDLNILPWPWEDGSFDEVCARAVFEHLDIPLLAAMDEAWRLLRAGGVADVKLPYWNAEVSYDDLQHRYTVGVGIFDGLDPRTEREHGYWFYTDRKWLIATIGLNQQQTSVVAKLRKISGDEADIIRDAWITGVNRGWIETTVATWLACPKDQEPLLAELEWAHEQACAEAETVRDDADQYGED